MKILTIGGTYFLGRHVVEQALARGWEVTVFHRGKHGAELFPGVDRVVGNRDGDLGLLGDRTWDAVIDTCGYTPRPVRESAGFCRSRASHYVFVSTLNAYAMNENTGIDEDAPLMDVTGIDTEKFAVENYGALKVLCEQAVCDEFGKDAWIIRPGLIVGAHDPSDRFTWWPYRIRRGGDILCPGDPQSPQQWIDAADLARWILNGVERHVCGTFNAVGPESPVPFAAFTGQIREILGVKANFHWMNDHLVEQHGVNIPGWLPRDWWFIGSVSVKKAMEAGLTYTPLANTVKATLAWLDARPDHQWQAGIEPEKEKELIASL